MQSLGLFEWAGEDLDLGDLVLDSPAVLRGQVTSPDGKPVAGLPVHVSAVSQTPATARQTVPPETKRGVHPPDPSQKSSRSQQPPESGRYCGTRPAYSTTKPAPSAESAARARSAQVPLCE